MKWKIKINGNKNYLEDLTSISEKFNVDPKIYKEREEYFLEGSIFEDSDDAKEVLEKTRLYLTVMSNASILKPDETLELMKVENLSWASEDNKTRKIYDQEGDLNTEEIIKEDGSIQRNVTLKIEPVVHKTKILKVIISAGKEIPNFDSLGEIKAYIERIENDSTKMNEVKQLVNSKLEPLRHFVGNFYSDLRIKEINELKTVIDAIVNLKSKMKNQSENITGLEIAEWACLYRIYEIIEKDIESKNKECLETKQWLKGKQWETFQRNADYYHRHSAKRLFKLVLPPKRVMPISEAKELISTLLLKYIEEKANHQKINKKLKRDLILDYS